MTTQNKFDKTSLQEKAAEYHALSDADYNHFLELGRIATAQHQLGQETFPIKSERVRYQRGGRRIPNIEMHSRDEEQVLYGQRLFAGGVPHMQTHASGPVKETINRLVGAHTAHLSAERRQKEKDRNAMHAQIFEESADTTATLLMHRQRLQQIPAVKFTAFPSHSPSLAPIYEPDDTVPGTWRSNRGETTCETLETSWKMRHVAVRATPWQEPDPGTKSKPAQCYAAGVCHCRAGGALLRTLHQRLRAFLSKIDDNEFQKRLVEGYIVLQFCRVSPPAPEGSVQFPQPGICVDGQTSTVVNTFLHIALHYRKPWSSTLVRMHLADAEQSVPSVEDTTVENQEGRAHIPTIYLRACSECGELEVQSVWQCLQTVEATAEMRIGIWELSSLQTPVPSLDVVVARRHSVARTVLWAGLEKEMRAKRARPRASLYQDRGVWICDSPTHSHSLEASLLHRQDSRKGCFFKAFWLLVTLLFSVTLVLVLRMMMRIARRRTMKG